MDNDFSTCDHNQDAERGFFCTLNSVDLEQGLRDGGRIGRIDQILDWGVEKTDQDIFSGMIAVANG
jgi:hypothetical protein